MNLKKSISIGLALIFLGIAGLATYLIVLTSNLPKMITLEDYAPLLVSQVYDRKGEKIGEFFRQKRSLVPYSEIPPHVIHAFVSAEDDTFFQHGGVNYQSMLRAFIANIKAGRRVQGGSTITQQVARSLLLTREKTYTRKIKEIFLSYRMESNLSKEDILYLYLNQIYLGQGSYGVANATQNYFRKPLKEITVGEAALLAGLPQAPSRYSPINNPSAAKSRQRYVLKRMAEEGYITEDIANSQMETPLQVFVRQDYKELAPFYLETVRQLLIKHLGEEMVLDKGIKVYTSLDLQKQLNAKQQIDIGLREVDKRQGFRGPIKHLEDPQEVADFLLKTRDELIDNVSPVRVLQPDGTIPAKEPLNLTGKDKEGNPLPNIPHYIEIDQIVEGIVTNVDDDWGLVTVRFAETRGLIDFETMEWARTPDPNRRSEWDKIKKPSEAVKKGDVVQVKIKSKKFYSSRVNKLIDDKKKKHKGKTPWERPEELPVFEEFARIELEQEPIVEGGLVSIDQNNSDIVALVGGYDYNRSQFNRALQAARQTGSAFKSFVYTSALDKGYTPSTPIIDAPVVFKEEEADKTDEGQDDVILAGKGGSKEEKEDSLDGDKEDGSKSWKPMNHSKRFMGDILFRNALIRSLNVPTVKIIEKIGVDWVARYARRLGIFSPLNLDYTLALGSSGVTLYEMTKAFSQIGKMGRKVQPIVIHKVVDQNGEILLENLSLDDRFETEVTALNEEFEKRRKAYLAFKKSHPALAAKVDGKILPPKDERLEAPEEETVAEEPAPSGDEEFRFTKKTFLREPPLYFDDPEQLMKPTTAYIITSLLQAAVDEPQGTGGRARSLGRPVAAKTGSSSGYFDGWFVGYTTDLATGVWVGFDHEKSMGIGEVGGKTALPIWLEFMKYAHEGLPERNFPVPDNIVFANIDNETGKLASANSAHVVRQAFVEGTEPSEVDEEEVQDLKNFYKEELSE